VKLEENKLNREWN